MEPSTFLRAMLTMWLLGAGAGYAVRRSGLDQVIIDRFHAIADRNNRRYAAILAEEIGDRIIVIGSPALALAPEQEMEAGKS
jgi:hypothetical protein